MCRKLRWPGGKPVCPVCSSTRTGQIVTRHLRRCLDCRKQFSDKQGTLFESPLQLGQWFFACWILYNYPKTTCQRLSDLVGVTVRTAWQMRRKWNAGLSLIVRPGTFEDTIKQLFFLSKNQINEVLKPPKSR
ncbi:transposase [Sulfurimonas sp.]|uniref:transposase n=1 Tax=Sulfurimonas sp. TaxID=2022749 RepID=UPI00345AFDDD